MDFIEITVSELDGEAAEAVSDLFNRYGHGGAIIETYPPHFDKTTVRTVIPGEDKYRLQEIEILLSLIGQALPNGLPLIPKIQSVNQTDWAESWKENFHVVRVARRFVIKPSWREYPSDMAEDDIIIEIDPGLAFGSGLHPTTQLCLEILETMPLQQKTFFDVGTGSGILSLAALKLGVQTVRAVDIDEVAVRIAQENFERNGHPSQKVETAIGSAGERGGKQWDVVAANILAHILIDIMPDLVAAVAPEGELILSGMIDEQEEAVIQSLADYPFQILKRHSIDDWTALVAKRLS